MLKQGVQCLEKRPMIGYCESSLQGRCTLRLSSLSRARRFCLLTQRQEAVHLAKIARQAPNVYGPQECLVPQRSLYPVTEVCHRLILTLAVSCQAKMQLPLCSRTILPEI
jgi:hypothetical protein